MTNQEQSWREKIENCRGYDRDDNEPFIVFDNINQIWNSHDLANFIEDLIQTAVDKRTKEILELIGENENSWYDNFGNIWHNIPNAQQEIRNEFREELRQQVTNLKSK